MPRPVTLRDQMKTAVQLGVPDVKPSSARPVAATPTEERLAEAERLLRDGSPIGWVADYTGLSRCVVRVVANCRLVGWRFEVKADSYRPPYRMDAEELATVRLRLAQGKKYTEIANELGVNREAVKFQARKIREREAGNG